MKHLLDDELNRKLVAMLQAEGRMPHAELAIGHSKAWNAGALVPLVEENPACARYLAEGAIMRLVCGEQCFETYRAHLWAHAHPLVYAAE